MAAEDEENVADERTVILEALVFIEKNDVYADSVIKDVLDKYSYLPSSSRAFIKRVLEGSTERRIELDHIIDQVSKTPVNRMKPVIRSIMRMSVYQLKYMDSVPASAAINEAVSLAGRKGFKTLKAFVNGVLRNIERNLDRISYPDRNTDPGSFLSIRYSCPLWLTEHLISERGFEYAKRMLESSLGARDLTVRTNLSKISVSDLMERLKEEGVDPKEHPYLPYALILKNVENLRSIKAFKEGLFQVQDVSSQLAIEAAGIKEGSFVVDVCASPGGKALHAADILASFKGGSEGSVLARDLTENKLALIDENAARHAFSNIRTGVWDALIYDPGLKEKADLVIADLPCSGIGIIGRKADIKYRIVKEDLESLSKLQRDILSVVSSYVKKGGRLLYSTCTVDRCENEDNAAWITENLPFKPLPLEGVIREVPGCDSFDKGYIQLINGVHLCDGFFISLFERI